MGHDCPAYDCSVCCPIVGSCACGEQASAPCTLNSREPDSKRLLSVANSSLTFTASRQSLHQHRLEGLQLAAATRFYTQLGRLKPLAERYMKLRALFGPLLRPSALYITEAAVEARLDALGLPPAAAPEFVVEARRNAAAFKQLVGL